MFSTVIRKYVSIVSYGKIAGITEVSPIKRSPLAEVLLYL